jgi:hypothetical protein
MYNCNTATTRIFPALTLLRFCCGTEGQQGSIYMAETQ